MFFEKKNLSGKSKVFFKEEDPGIEKYAVDQLSSVTIADL